jgi:hypothetical protein
VPGDTPPDSTAAAPPGGQGAPGERAPTAGARTTGRAASAGPGRAGPSTAIARYAGPVGFPVLVLALVGVLAAIGRMDVAGGSEELAGLRWATVAAAYWTLLVSAPLAGAYLLAGVGLGRLARPLIGPSPHALWLSAAVGVGLMLLLSHLAGLLGALSGPAGTWAAWAIVGVGLALFVDDLARGGLRPETWPVAPAWILSAAPAVALMLVAAASPPGWLWASEKGGFDVLSYHLQLPREWADGAGIRPLAHNVYSFLPSYMESAYTHMAAMTRPLAGAGEPALIGGAGVGLLACQVLHAGMGMLTALLVGRAVAAMLGMRRPDTPVGAGASPSVPNPLAPAPSVLPAVVAGAFALSVPWAIVVGSMAYNELAVTAMGAGALLAAMDADAAPWRRGALCGLLVGLACSAKPTAALLVAPWAGAVLLGMMPARRWPAACAAGALAAVLAMAPWMARNAAAAGGNPLFPFAASILGADGWTAEQVARYARAHAPDSAGLSLLLSRDRGIAHEQWSIVFPLAAAALGAGAWYVRTRRVASLLAAGSAVSIALWLALTHGQSRFLVPLLVPIAASIGLATGAAAAATRRAGALPRTGAALLAALLPPALAARATAIFVAEHGGQPNRLLAGGPPMLTGSGLEIGAPDEGTGVGDERDAFARLLAGVPSPELYVNLALPDEPDGAIYLLGDSTPLYYRPRVLYHTTWDRSPLGDAVRQAGDDPAAWARILRERGIRYIVVNMSELHRLIEADGWYDPDVTVDRVRRLLAAACTPLREWPSRGQVLARLHDAPRDAEAPTPGAGRPPPGGGGGGAP